MSKRTSQFIASAIAVATLGIIAQSPAHAGHWTVQFQQPSMAFTGGVYPGTHPTIVLPSSTGTVVNNQVTYFAYWYDGYGIGSGYPGAINSSWTVKLTWVPTNNNDPATTLTEWDGTPSFAGSMLTNISYEGVPLQPSVGDNLGQPNGMPPVTVGVGPQTAGMNYSLYWALPARGYNVVYSGNATSGIGLTRAIDVTLSGGGGGGGGCYIVYGFTAPVDPVGP